MVVCRKCGGVMMVDGMAKVRADVAKSTGLEVCDPVLTYSCEPCGLSFTEYETTPKWGDDEPEYGSALWELNFD